jgi:hypothetical protein
LTEAAGDIEQVKITLITRVPVFMVVVISYVNVKCCLRNFLGNMVVIIQVKNQVCSKNNAILLCKYIVGFKVP